MTKIIKCTCQHEWQDKQYGKGNRVMNAIGTRPDEYRCTVCEKITKGDK